MTNKSVRIGVTGGRDYTDRAKVNKILDMALGALLEQQTTMILVVGCCPTGLDLFAREWGAHSLPNEHVEIFMADWEKFGPKAGFIRNSAMVKSGLNLLLSFPGGRGTADCTQKAIRAGIRVETIR